MKKKAGERAGKRVPEGAERTGKARGPSEDVAASNDEGHEIKVPAGQVWGEQPPMVKGEKRMEAGELGSVWTESAKKALELYVESGERMAKMMLELHERSTSWAKETMLAPLLEAQRSAAKQMIESSVEIGRKLCGMDGATRTRA
jgi:hypothetical protein